MNKRTLSDTCNLQFDVQSFQSEQFVFGKRHLLARYTSFPSRRAYLVLFSIIFVLESVCSRSICNISLAFAVETSLKYLVTAHIQSRVQGEPHMIFIISFFLKAFSRRVREKRSVLPQGKLLLEF